jgi:hypothetical protein
MPLTYALLSYYGTIVRVLENRSGAHVGGRETILASTHAVQLRLDSGLDNFSSVSLQ